MLNSPLLIARSLLFNLCYFFWSLLASLIFAPLFLISSRASLLSGKPWALGVLLLARIICGITYEIRGREHISKTPVIYASKHQSAWDTMIFLVLFKPCPAYVLKRELLRIPFWGWYLWRMKMVAIDRSGKASSMKQMVKDSKDVMASGRSVVIFPEGTRTRAGEAGEHHPGVVALYSFLKVPVVPVALNSGVVWARDAFIKKPGHIVLEFLPAIPAGLDKENFSRQLHEAIESNSMRLYTQAHNAHHSPA